MRASRATVLAAALVLVAVCTAALGGIAAAKKGGKSRTFEQTKQANLAIPDRPGAGPGIPVESQITIPKKFKGKTVGDVNVTLQTTGSGPSAANDLNFRLSSPTGRTVQVLAFLGDQNIGPLTLDDDTPTLLCDSAIVECGDPNATLPQPFAGTASGDSGGNYFNLWRFNGVRMRGTWTLAVYDLGMGDTSTLNSWGLRVKAQKPPPAD